MIGDKEATTMTVHNSTQWTQSRAGKHNMGQNDGERDMKCLMERQLVSVCAGRVDNWSIFPHDL